MKTCYLIMFGSDYRIYSSRRIQIPVTYEKTVGNSLPFSINNHSIVCNKHGLTDHFNNPVSVTGKKDI